MLIKGKVHFEDNRMQTYNGTVYLKGSWVFLADDQELYPQHKVQKVEMHTPMSKLKKMLEVPNDLLPDFSL